jgi:hypothetical protein
MMFKGDFAPIFHKHTSRLDLTDLLSVGVDKMQRNFEPLKQQINEWQTREIDSDQAKLVIYRAFVEERFPSKLLTPVHNHYFTPQYEEFKPRTMWSLSNAFTSAFKVLGSCPAISTYGKDWQVLAELLNAALNPSKEIEGFFSDFVGPNPDFDMEANLFEPADHAFDDIETVKLQEIMNGTCDAVACLSGHVILASADSETLGKKVEEVNSDIAQTVLNLTDEEADAFFSVIYWPEPYREDHGLLYHDCHELERWPEPYRSGFRRAKTLAGQQRWEAWACIYFHARYRAEYRDRKQAAIELLDEIIRRQSVWWVHEPPGVQKLDVVFNFQQGATAPHAVPQSITVGDWTITGVRAHADANDHTGPFVPT